MCQLNWDAVFKRGYFDANKAETRINQQIHLLYVYRQTSPIL